MDGAVFLVCQSLAGDVQEAGLARTVGDHHFLELGLEEAQAHGDVVVVVAVEIGFFVRAEEAEVTEFEFDAVVGGGVAGAVRGVGAGSVCAVGVVGFWGVLVCDRGGWWEGFGLCGVELAVCEGVEIHAGVVAEEVVVAWASAAGCRVGVAIFHGWIAVFEAEEGEKPVG